MGRWVFDISDRGGNELHRMVAESSGDGESLARILEQIQSCCRESINMIKEADLSFSADRFEDLANLMNGEADLCRGQDLGTIREWGYCNFEDLIDSRLEEFYDLCDDQRVWLGDGIDEPAPEIHRVSVRRNCSGKCLDICR